MSANPMTAVMRKLRRIVLARSDKLCEERLLEAFIQSSDETAFETIVRRHGSLVIGVCRRVLRNHHDAEDAFQATFLVLARKAASIVKRGALAHWLYGVAFHASLKAKAAAAKRRKREQESTAMHGHETVPQQFDLHDLVDQELNRLPEKYRSSIVLCDLEGRTRK